MLNVVLYATSSSLRDALTASLDEFAAQISAVDALPVAGPCAGCVVVAPAGDCAPEACARLAALGWRVIVLATIPREVERTNYLACGAAGYVPMTVRSDQLWEEIVSALEAVC